MSIRLLLRHNAAHRHRCGEKAHIHNFAQEIACQLAKSLNLTANFVDIPKADQRYGSCYKNGTCTGVMRLLVEGEADVGTDCFWYTENRNAAAEFANPIFVDDYGFLISPVLFEQQKESDAFSQPFPFSILFLIWSVWLLWTVKDILYQRFFTGIWPQWSTLLDIQWQNWTELMSDATNPRLAHLLASTIILIVFWAATRGVVLVIQPEKLPFESVEELINQIKLGKVQFTASHPDMLKVTGLDRQYPQLVDAYWNQNPMPPLLPKLHSTGSTDQGTLCSKRVVAIETATWKHLNLPCTPFFLHLTDTTKFFADLGKYCSILISRKRSKQFREAVNRVITTVYNIGMETRSQYFWDLEALQQEKRNRVIDGGKPNPVSLEGLLIPIVIFFAVQCSLLLILIVEIVIYRTYSCQS